MEASPPERRRRAVRACAAALVGLVLLRFGAVEWCLWRATDALAARRHESAQAWLDWSGRLGERSGEGAFLRARTARRLGRLDQVEPWIARSESRGWNAADLRRERWLLAAQQHRFDAMSSHFSELFLDAREDGPEISEAFVRWCLSKFRIRSALEVLDAWQRDFPEDPQPHFLRGQIAEAQLAHEDAVREFQACLAKRPEHTEARFRLAENLMPLLRHDDAEKHYSECVRRRGDDPTTVVAWARCLLKLNRRDEVRRALATIRTVHAADLEVAHATGELELADDHPGAAAEALKRVVERRPENHATRFLYGQALQRSGRADEAAAHFEFARDAQKSLAKLGELTRAAVQRPHDVAARHEVGRITWTYKSRVEGTRWLESVLEYDPKHRPTLALLAEHYRAAGEPDLADAFRRRAEGTP